jgi:hypothetical protein
MRDAKGACMSDDRPFDVGERDDALADVGGGAAEIETETPAAPTPPKPAVKRAATRKRAAKATRRGAAKRAGKAKSRGGRKATRAKGARGKAAKRGGAKARGRKTARKRR